MFAMILAPLGKNDPSMGPASLTFYGPDSTRQIKAINANGFESARFMIDGDKKSFTISRLTSPTTAPVQICIASKSSLSGTTTLMVHGNTELKSRVQLTYTLDTPTWGKLTWSDGSLSSKRKLKDKQGNVLAVGTMKKEISLQVLIQGDELLLDCLLAGWMALVIDKNASDGTASETAAGLEAFGAVLNVVGGGGA